MQASRESDQAGGVALEPALHPGVPGAASRRVLRAAYNAGPPPVLLVPTPLRLFVKRLVEPTYPNLAVMGYTEVAASAPGPVGRNGGDPWTSSTQQAAGADGPVVVAAPDPQGRLRRRVSALRRRGRGDRTPAHRVPARGPGAGGRRGAGRGHAPPARRPPQRASRRQPLAAGRGRDDLPPRSNASRSWWRDRRPTRPRPARRRRLPRSTPGGSPGGRRRPAGTVEPPAGPFRRRDRSAAPTTGRPS